MNIKEIKELIKIVNDTDVTELLVETEGIKLSVKKGHPPVLQAAPMVHPAYNANIPAVAGDKPAAAGSVPASASKSDDDEISENHLIIAAPMVGTFYRAPSPEAPPYVEVGTVVKHGQPVCIIEAMKLMNEIESEVSGKIVRILVDNAQPVEYGQPLFVLEKV